MRPRLAGGTGHTAREIAQQPRLWRELVVAPEPVGPGRRVVLTGAGSSAFAGEILAPALRRALRRRVDAVATTDLVADPHGALGDDVPTLLVSFARSGDSPESVAATELADRLLSDVRHLVVTCNPDGALARAHAGSRVLVMPDGSNDRGFAMTSSLTCMMLAVLLAFEQVGRERVERLAAAVEDALPGLDAWADGLTGAGRVVHLGAGPLTGLAREAALKLTELTAGRVATWHDSPLGFRHGPKSVLDDDTLVVVHVSTDPYTRAYDLDMLRELAGSVRLVAVSTVPLEGIPTLTFPALVAGPDELVAQAYLVAAQTLALRYSLALGLTPDDPFPGGEVNRVVRGVTVHRL